VKLLRASNGEVVNLASATTLGVGGEARIFAVLNSPDLAAKVYHRPAADRAAKLAAMLANPPDDPEVRPGHVSIAWPSELLLDNNGSGKVMGFLMPRVRAMSPIIDFYHPKTRRQKHPLFNYQYLLRTARNLAACVSALHARGYVIGDLNESNILVGETALVTLVDTDSFQVPDPQNGKVYRCRVGKPEFTPPELQSVSFAWVDRKQEHDLFGLAVILFQLLMEGIHPFAGQQAGRGEPAPLEDRIAAGWFPYAPGRACGTLPMPTSPDFQLLDQRVRDLFIRCFLEGHSQPSCRPDAQAWQGALLEAENSLTTCPANDQHRFGNHLGACPWCKRRQLLGGLDPFPSVEMVKQRRHLRPLLRRFRPREARPADPAAVDYETAIAVAMADIKRQRLVRRLCLPGLVLLVAALLCYWAWAIRLALARQ
jgi:DNA-binding helix-hairpin-helix protein with protein kinase domain